MDYCNSHKSDSGDWDEWNGQVIEVFLAWACDEDIGGPNYEDEWIYFVKVACFAGLSVTYALDFEQEGTIYSIDYVILKQYLCILPLEDQAYMDIDSLYNEDSFAQDILMEALNKEVASLDAMEGTYTLEN